MGLISRVSSRTYREKVLKMVLVLIIGDAHVPHRSPSIPTKFQTLLKPGKIQHVLCIGNITCQGTLDYLKTLPSGNLHTVLGDMDSVENLNAPESLEVNIADLKIGLIHGHQLVPWSEDEALDEYRRKIGVDILVSGHSHNCKVEAREGGFYVNPGSCTGAMNTHNGQRYPPSFVLLDIQGNSCVAYVYKLKADDEVAVEKQEFKKAAAKV